MSGSPKLDYQRPIDRAKQQWEPWRVAALMVFLTIIFSPILLAILILVFTFGRS